MVQTTSPGHAKSLYTAFRDPHPVPRHPGHTFIGCWKVALTLPFTPITAPCLRLPPASQALHLQELKFQMAVRDQIISEQRQVIGNLWTIIDKSGLPRDRCG